MRMLPLFSVGFLMMFALQANAAPPAKESAGSHPAGQATPVPTQPTKPASQNGRFQLMAIPGHPGSPFLLDSATGCIWHQVHSDETKRTTFVEVDVENLHWSWGSGAQQVLAARVDGATIPDDQKRLLKDGLQKTACGISNVVLTPGGQSATGQTPVPKP